MNPSVLALIGYIAWTATLLAGIAALRIWVASTGRHPANSFRPDGSDVSPFSGRLCRAHANCYEHFPLIGGTLLLAIASNTTMITNGLALWLLAARVAQSTVHLISSTVRVVQLRFAFFVVQYAIVLYWIYELSRHFLRV
ncbi:MAG: MAPEG family protein [Acidiferrobacteraceae bacterium]